MIERHAVRALLLNPAEEILLIKIIEPKSKRTFWLTPGGGIDNGEAPTTTLRRELFEETGLTAFEIGPLSGNENMLIPGMDTQSCNGSNST